jgi:DNA-binding LytR/AlgR family response regulator
MTPQLEHEQLSSLLNSDQGQPVDSGKTQPEEWDEFIPTNDFALVAEKARCWMVRASDISALEAFGDCTRVHLSDATPLIRRPLRECERRLDPSLFFRARPDCIVNLARVKQTRVLAPFQLVFVLQDGQEILASQERSLVFRRSRGL